MIEKKIEIPLYYQTLHIVVTEDAEKDQKQIKRIFNAGFERFEFAGYAESQGKLHLIVLNKKHMLDDFIDPISVITHESFHITNFIMKRIGILPDVNNDEAQAYLLSWIVEEVSKVFFKGYEKKRKS